jgi:hypothetical protein
VTAREYLFQRLQFTAQLAVVEAGICKYYFNSSINFLNLIEMFL